MIKEPGSALLALATPISALHSHIRVVPSSSGYGYPGKVCLVHSVAIITVPSHRTRVAAGLGVKEATRLPAISTATIVTHVSNHNWSYKNLHFPDVLTSKDQPFPT